MSDNKWTPEPWKEYSDRNIDDFALVRMDGYDYERARECVNALAGVGNPKEYLETILKQRDELAIELANVKSTLDNAMELINRNLP